MGSVEDRLREAAAAGEILTIIYGRGTQPGTKRDIVPLQIVEGGRLEARCLATNAFKTFFVAHLQIVDPGHAAAPYTSKTAYKDLWDVMAHHGDEFDLIGWHVETLGDAMALRRRAPDGSPIGNAVVVIARRARRPPWIVTGLGRAEGYAALREAAPVFVSMAREAARSPPATTESGGFWRYLWRRLIG